MSSSSLLCWWYLWCCNLNSSSFYGACQSHQTWTNLSGPFQRFWVEPIGVTMKLLRYKPNRTWLSRAFRLVSSTILKGKNTGWKPDEVAILYNFSSKRLVPNYVPDSTASARMKSTQTVHSGTGTADHSFESASAPVLPRPQEEENKAQPSTPAPPPAPSDWSGHRPHPR